MRLLFIGLMGAVSICSSQDRSDEQACLALTDVPDLSIASATIRRTNPGAKPYCYVKGSVPPGIRYHVQLPLPGDWNGRFLHWGDGGLDGDLDFADHRVRQGYAVANSNLGHDAGSEPGYSFAFNSKQAEIDYGYRAVHVTVIAAKTLIRAYYRRPARYSYHEGYSTGGREGFILKTAVE